MKFSNISELKIPEGNVNRILYGETVLWEKPLLPAAYQQVEYIHNPKDAYINTGFMHNQDTRVVMKVQATEIKENSYAFEGRESQNKNSKGVFWYTATNTWSVDYYKIENRKSFNGIQQFDILEIDYDKNNCTINGITVTNSALKFSSTRKLVLMARNDGGTIDGFLVGNLYYAKIYDNDVLVRDYIPYYRKTDGVYGMYDLVNKTFVTSSSSTAFTGE